MSPTDPKIYLALALTACSAPSSPPPMAAAAQVAGLPGTIALPGGDADGVGMDYLAYDPRTNTVWVPAGNSGAVDVVDAATGKLTRIDGFTTHEVERGGKKRIVGPSSATLGAPGTVYVGNRADSSVCAVDERTLIKGACGTLDSSPDGISFVASTNEVWVTTPRDKSIRILDAATLAQKAKIDLDGKPEGFAPDPTRGRFYTNFEDKDVTIAIDLASHQIVATWKSSCGEDGPHGIRLAEADGLLVVACSAKVEALDVAHDGAILGSLDTGDGLDDIDYQAATRRIYAGAAKSATLAIAYLDPKGLISSVSNVPTKEGARNGVASTAGAVFLAHSKGAELVVVAPR